jgi:hypothetical protein
VFLGSEDWQPLMDNDRPLPSGLPAVELRLVQRRVRDFRLPMTALKAGRLGPVKTEMAENHPTRRFGSATAKVG